MSYSIRLFIATAILAHAAIAFADETPEAALQRGRAALKAGRVHEACDAFAASDKLAPSVDTELALASCYEQDGKTTAAARLYRSVADTDANVTRREASIAKAAKLEARAPKLRFAINPLPPGLVIKVDGIQVPTAGDVPVDLGPHDVVATAPGFQGHTSAPVDRERTVVDVILRMEPVAEPPAAPPSTATPEPAPAPTAPSGMTPAATETAAPVDHRRRNGWIVAGSGAAVLVGAAVLFGWSSSKFDDEHALCPHSQCASDADLDKAHSILSDAHTLRGFSIGLGITSGVLLAAGGYFLLTPHKEESRVTFHVEPGGAGVAYSARF